MVHDIKILLKSEEFIMNAVMTQNTAMSRTKNNKGFSLVELIIVIAIMAVLTALLAPQFLKYVEKSRESRDSANIALVHRTIQTALVDEATYTSVATGTLPITIDMNYVKAGTMDTTNLELAKELEIILGKARTANVITLEPLVSKKYATGVTFTIVIESPPAGTTAGSVKVSWKNT